MPLQQVSAAITVKRKVLARWRKSPKHPRRHRLCAPSQEWKTERRCQKTWKTRRWTTRLFSNGLRVGLRATKRFLMIMALVLPLARPRQTSINRKSRQRDSSLRTFCPRTDPKAPILCSHRRRLQLLHQAGRHRLPNRLMTEHEMRVPLFLNRHSQPLDLLPRVRIFR
jgi:hypothetical protein